MDTSSHEYERVMSHIWMNSYQTFDFTHEYTWIVSVPRQSHVWTSPLTHINDASQTYGRVMWQMYATKHEYTWSMYIQKRLCICAKRPRYLYREKYVYAKESYMPVQRHVKENDRKDLKLTLGWRVRKQHVCTCIQIHAYMHTCIHTCMHAYTHRCLSIRFTMFSGTQRGDLNKCDQSYVTSPRPPIFQNKENMHACSAGKISFVKRIYTTKKQMNKIEKYTNKGGGKEHLKQKRGGKKVTVFLKNK